MALTSLEYVFLFFIHAADLRYRATFFKAYHGTDPLQIERVGISPFFLCLLMDI